MKPKLFTTIRKLNGLTQQDMADRLGVSRSLIMKIENGDRALTADVRNKLMNNLTLTPELLAEINRLIKTLED